MSEEAITTVVDRLAFVLLQPHTLHLGSMIFEPQLYVLWLELWKSLTILCIVQFVCVMLYCLRTRVGVRQIPLLQSWNFCRRIDEDPAPLSPVVLFVPASRTSHVVDVVRLRNEDRV